MFWAVFYTFRTMPNAKFFKPYLCLMIGLVFWCQPKAALCADDIKDEIPTRYGLAAVLAKTFDPVGNIYFVQMSGFVMWDYDKIWRHWAPDPLRFKIEATAGMTVSPYRRAIISTGMMALYYLEFISNPRLLPFIEGGIGAIYTDFKVEDQGSRFNFNPRIGIGTEFNIDFGQTLFSTIRLSHISNGGLLSKNRGINSVEWMIGYIF